MLQELKTAKKVVGAKQLRKALKEQTVAHVFLAQDADPRLTGPIEELCRNEDIDVQWVPTMAQLGHACAIEVGAAMAGLLR